MIIGICDDNPDFVDILSDMLLEYYQIRKIPCPVIIKFNDGKSLLDYKDRIDLLFLDMEMPQMNGIEAGNKLCALKKAPLIIVITSYMDYLDDAMKIQVFRFLSKPLNKERLFRNLTEAIKYLSTQKRTIIVETKEGVNRINISDIIVITSQNRKCLLITPDKRYETKNKIEQWQSLLPSHTFFRSHKSFLVNLNYVTSFSHSQITLKNTDLDVYLTVRKYQEFKHAFTFIADNK